MDHSHSNGSVNEPRPHYLWGARAIADEIGRSERATHHLLSTGQIRCAKRKGGRYVAELGALRREFGAS
jgi:hypothetical protein